MNKRRLILLTLFFVIGVFLVSGVNKPAHAWPWDKTVTVKIDAVPRNWQPPAAVQCSRATLYANGKSYTGSISNAWTTAKCTATFYNVPVKTPVTISISGKLIFVSFSKTAYRNTGNPPWTGNTVTLEKLYIN